MSHVVSQFLHPFVQRACVELLLLCVTAAALGPWILMRGLGFFGHAIGTAAFPGLIAADALGITPQLGATLGAMGVAAGSGVVSPTARTGTRTALWLTGAMAVGALLASNISRPGAGVDSALFGSLLTSTTADLMTAAGAACLAVGAVRLGGPRWLSEGMLGRSWPFWNSILLGVVAVAVIAQLAAVGALLASTLLVLPAAAARPWATTIQRWGALTGGIAAAVSVVGLLSSLSLDTPPGATIAVAAGLAVIGSIASHSAAGSIARAPKAIRLGTGMTVVALLTLTAGCAQPSGPPVVATTPIIGSITQQVAGRDIKVKTLIPAGADPHSYEPRPSDIDALSTAKLLVRSGPGMDDWATRVEDRSGGHATILNLAEGLPVVHTGSQFKGTDPHWFHDPRNIAAAALTVGKALSKIDPSHSTGYLGRASQLAAVATSLDKQGRLCAARLGRNERNLVTDHDAFGYLAARLGLRILGTLIPSQSTTAAPSPRELDRLAREIRSLGVKAIFPERAIDPRLAANLARQAGASSKQQLDADTLGPAGTRNATWQGMWAKNVETLVTALSGGRINCPITQNGGGSR
ncbi:MAG: zinc ABC transporter substrate-binding protein [Actinomycetes bacterium]